VSVWKAAARAVKDVLRARLLELSRANVAARLPAGELQRVELERSGRVRLVVRGELPALEVAVDGAAAPLAQSFEMPDGRICAEYAANPQGLARSVTVSLEGRVLARLSLALPLRRPDWAELFDEQRVLTRDEIYGVGPPHAVANEEVLRFASELPGPLLDFGCGQGALLRELRAKGIDARGIEIRRPAIVDALTEEVKPFVHLYEGALPLPFESDRFAAVVCTEVLEHVPDPVATVRELARLAPRALFTVPDMSAVPALFPHAVVPWHLLEASHLSFFTQRSLGALLGGAYREVRFSRLGRFVVNGTEVFTSLVARCTR